MTPSKPESPPLPADGQTPRRGGKGRASSGLMALGAAAVLTVYSAGYARTEEAAKRIAESETGRRPPGRLQGTEDAGGAGSGSGAGAGEAGSGAEAGAPGNQAVAVEGTAAFSDGRATAVGTSDLASAAPGTTSTGAKPAASAQTTTPGETSSGAQTGGSTAPPPAAEPAPAAVDSTALRPDFPPWKDGTYFGWGRSRHGDIEARLEIREGRITSAVIADCRTRYSCSVIDRLIPQVVERQSPDVDTVSGATQSADAWYYAVYEALSKSKP